MPEDNFYVPLMCPICATVFDCHDVGKIEIECVTCETKFSVEVDEAKVNEFAV